MLNCPLMTYQSTLKVYIVVFFIYFNLCYCLFFCKLSFFLRKNLKNTIIQTTHLDFNNFIISPRSWVNNGKKLNLHHCSAFLKLKLCPVDNQNADSYRPRTMRSTSFNNYYISRMTICLPFFILGSQAQFAEMYKLFV